MFQKSLVKTYRKTTIKLKKQHSRYQKSITMILWQTRDHSPTKNILLCSNTTGLRYIETVRFFLKTTFDLSNINSLFWINVEQPPRFQNTFQLHQLRTFKNNIILTQQPNSIHTTTPSMHKHKPTKELSIL